jgi:hypothetical protein
VAGLVPYARNARTHSPEQVAQIAASIREWGWTVPVLVDESGTIIAGHGRVLAAQQLGLPDVAVMVASGWSEAKRRAYTIADNRLALSAGWDEAMLSTELSDLASVGFDLDLLVFDAQELGALLTPDPPDADASDWAPELDDDATSAPGDIWLLGRHRLMCGDSSDARSVLGLTRSAQWDVVVLDPPFEMPESRWTPWIYDPCVLFGQAKHLRAVPSDLWRFERVIVKRGMHRCATVHVGHMHSFIAQIGSSKVCPTDAQTFPSVLDQESDLVHEYQKPVGALLQHLTQWLAPWDVVIDPFAGSGTTLMAAQRTGRIGRTVEIAPQYVDVALIRFQQNFPGAPVTLADTGEPFEVVAQQRKAERRQESELATV